MQACRIVSDHPLCDGKTLSGWDNRFEAMSSIARIFLVLLLLLLVGGALASMLVEIPISRTPVEQVIPHDRLSQ